MPYPYSIPILNAIHEELHRGYSARAPQNIEQERQAAYRLAQIVGGEPIQQNGIWCVKLPEDSDWKLL